MFRILSLASCILISACVSAIPDALSYGLSLSRTIVLDDLRSPWSIAFIDDTSALITEKEGGLLRANLSSGETYPISGLPEDLVNDIRSEIVTDNGGLFDVLLDPMFEKEPWIYLSYSAQTASGRTTKIIRAKLQGDVLEDHQTLFVAEPFTDHEFHHYGGGMTFGADGKLYFTIGERIYHERSNPDLPIAQDPSDRRGKIYRVNRDGSKPEDDPDFGTDAVPGLYAIGIRAAQGMTIHPKTGEIWFSEHGSRMGDEINSLVAGANYGWPIITTGGYRDTDY